MILSRTNFVHSIRKERHNTLLLRILEQSLTYLEWFTKTPDFVFSYLDNFNSACAFEVLIG